MTHEVTHKRIVRTPNHPDNDLPDNEAQVFEEGDVFEPTDDELQAFGDRLRELHDSEVDESGE